MTLRKAQKISAVAAICTLTQVGAAQFIAKPYLQLGGDRQMGMYKSLTLVWHAPDREGTWAVRVRNAGRTGLVKNIRYRVVKREGVPEHRVYTAPMTNLAAGLALKYEVLLGGKTVFASASVAPKAPGQRFKFVVLGDTGINSAGQRRVMSAVHNQHPDMVAVAGDIVYPKGTIPDYRRNFFPIANSDVRAATVGGPSMRSTLWVAAPGNHDTGYRDAPDGLAFYDYWIQPAGGPTGGCFTFVYGNSHWVVLDSNPYVDWTKGKYRAWLEVALQGGTRSDWSFVLFHHPPYSSSKTHAGDTHMRGIADLLTNHRVDLVFSGHVHNYQRTHPMRTSHGGKRWSFGLGTVYVVSGAGGAPLYDQEQAKDRSSWKPFTASFQPGFSFSLVEVDGKTLNLRQLDPAGNVLDQLRILK
ncbi:MAG TPA: metallophosphoesterase [Fimbriimonas sp.]